jgi:carotenoid 1,2-hydratase
MSVRLSVPPLPQRSGEYLWLYTDAVIGDVTAVCIFLIGSVFSPRYAAGVSDGALPVEHCAVNVALYRRGRRLAWAFTEYAGVAHARPEGVAIGASTLRYARDGTLVVTIRERTAPWGRPLDARLELLPASTLAAALPLDAQRLHYWEPRIVRGTAWLEVPSLGIEGTGLGYHDANRGSAALGDGVPGWWWTRVHAADTSLVRYGVRGAASVIELAAHDGREPSVTHVPSVARRHRRSAWGLALPTDIGAGDVAVPARRLLESSPFYARQETHAGGLHALGESADFRRFRSPLIRWMAYFRMRTERAA